MGLGWMNLARLKSGLKAFFGERYMEMDNVRPQLDGVKFKESS